MGRRITGKRLSEKYGLIPQELLAYMEKGLMEKSLQAFNASGKRVYDIDNMNVGPPQQERILANRRWTINEMRKARGQSVERRLSQFPDGWHGISFALSQNEEEAKKQLNEVMEFYFDEEEFERLHSTKPRKERKRRYNEAYEKAREVARQSWQGDPSLTTAAVIRSKEMEELRESFRERYGKPFTDKTIRGWIQDLRPGYKGLVMK